ncbi:hypothetical protein CASFOL_000926 [Castilleja foliolosa]|uniref:cellulase n=1 Tax=Castilleja foliolosa TaxID=1961234 RepID=A0ABD3EL36_9LAMI
MENKVEIKRTIPRGANSKEFKTKKIFVGGIPTTVSEDELREFFFRYVFFRSSENDFGGRITHEGMENHDEPNALKKHVMFFDRNHDGIIYPFETFQGFRAIGAGLVLSSVAAVFINIGLSRKTRPGKGFSIHFPIEVENIKMAKHGSDSGVYDKEARLVPKHKHHPPPPDNYTQALNKALMFFIAQRSGKLPKHNNVSWRGNSCVKDGDSSTMFKDLSGGYYDAGDATKFNFPQSFAMTMLSWSVIEYSAKFEASGELNHVKDIIKWGTDYFLKTFNHTADTIDRVVSQVGKGDTTGGPDPNDHYCWMQSALKIPNVGAAAIVMELHWKWTFFWKRFIFPLDLYN